MKVWGGKGKYEVGRHRCPVSAIRCPDGNNGEVGGKRKRGVCHSERSEESHGMRRCPVSAIRCPDGNNGEVGGKHKRGVCHSERSEESNGMLQRDRYQSSNAHFKAVILSPAKDGRRCEC